MKETKCKDCADIEKQYSGVDIRVPSSLKRGDKAYTYRCGIDHSAISIENLSGHSTTCPKLRNVS